MPDMSSLPTVALFGVLVIGIVLLIAAGDFLVRGAAAMARKFGIPALIVGLTIVAFGTSAPELVVSVQAVLHSPMMRWQGAILFAGIIAYLYWMFGQAAHKLQKHLMFPMKLSA